MAQFLWLNVFIVVSVQAFADVPKYCADFEFQTTPSENLSIQESF